MFWLHYTFSLIFYTFLFYIFGKWQLIIFKPEGHFFFILTKIILIVDYVFFDKAKMN